MPDRIFIADEPAPAARATEEKPDPEALAFASWLSEQSETVQALAAEWGSMRSSRFKFYERQDSRGRDVFGVQCEHGQHESHQGHEHALFLLVDSHRTRAEDTPEFRARLEALGMTPKEALQRSQQMGRDVAKASGRMPIEDHDALVEAEMRRLESPPPNEVKR